MNKTAQIKKNHQFIVFQKLVVVSLLIGFLSAFLGISLKKITEYYEEIFFHEVSVNPIFYVIFPVFGLSVIYFLRQYLFKKKENKGIKEVFESTQSKSKNLPTYKIPSHFINGLLTVIFGGSTGIEVSTVVATATIGSVAQQKENVFRKYKTELICAGVAAGITALFSSPIAGILFAVEVISRKVTRAFILTNGIAVSIAFGLITILKEEPLFTVNVTTWHLKAIPYFILLGILAGINSVYLTRCVLFFKSQFGKIQTHYYKILLGSIVLSISLFVFPQLYGEGYHAIKMIFGTSSELPLTLTLALTFIGILILKPVVTSVTLASGGDGGVFAPSLFIGAFLGLLVASILNTFFNTQVIPVNFMIIGMAAVLSASIHAPFTAIFLVCGLTNDYTLFLPILAVCLISKYTAKMIYPYTVYTYSPSLIK
ncbi:chloride channel protein [Flavobacterium sp. Fl-318]|uniref:Chloride channel protein n=1 Tax=Flavobacterium cupriresistens TaxID=2893885 RepID=A0ABU4RI49_9FLAO|nr:MULTISPECIES: chloride channel protein [unclassified Flavobacterium]MDX6191185.1 chloride channel protein [Flavobacterium sp. Fl-318]UFH42496.1 chloride channel protein [Flavobacterium sp. F-323]